LAELLEVRFKGNRKAFYTWETPTPPKLGDTVVVEAERGVDLGQVSAVGEAAQKKCGVGCNGCAIAAAPKEPSGRALRIATADDTRHAADLRVSEDDVRRKVMDRARHHKLDMKVSDAEWQFDRKKLTIYFTAEERIDFRALVRDLASQFRARIELRQIGARDEAKRLDGVGRCGRQYCCSSWLPELRPVSLSLAKDQRLSLNPSQISGGCGRLLCCLRYEHEFYVTSRKRFPKEGRVLKTARGTEKVLAVDIFRERLLLRAEDGSSRTISLAELKIEIPPDTAVVDQPPADEPPASPIDPPRAQPPAQQLLAEGEPKRKRRGRRHGRRRKGGERPPDPSPPPPPPQPPAEGPGGG